MPTPYETRGTSAQDDSSSRLQEIDNQNRQLDAAIKNTTDPSRAEMYRKMKEKNMQERRDINLFRSIRR